MATDTKATKVAISVGDKTFTLHHKDDDKHFKPVHNLIRRDIWEGFIVGLSKDILDEDALLDMTAQVACVLPKSRSACKEVAVYPRSLQKIFLANIYFHRDHIM